MCYKKPGPRCSAHVAPQYAAAIDELKEAQRTHAKEGTPDSKLKVNQAQRNFYQKAVEYASTPQGYQQALAMAQRNNGAATDKGFWETIAAKGAAARKQSMRVMRLATHREWVGTQVTTSHTQPIAGKNVTLDPHALQRIQQKGILPEEVEQAFVTPEKVYPNGRYEGQWRVTGNGLCLTGEVTHGTFRVITVYYDGVFTPARKDQLSTQEGREYAERLKTGNLTQSRRNMATT